MHHQHSHLRQTIKSIIQVILYSPLVHWSEKGPPSEAKSSFFDNGGSLSKGGRGGGGRRWSRGSRGDKGGRLHGRPARQKLLKHWVHLATDHVLREKKEERQLIHSLSRGIQVNICHVSTRHLMHSIGRVSVLPNYPGLMGQCSFLLMLLNFIPMLFNGFDNRGLSSHASNYSWTHYERNILILKR